MDNVPANCRLSHTWHDEQRVTNTQVEEPNVNKNQLSNFRTPMLHGWNTAKHTRCTPHILNNVIHKWYRGSPHVWEPHGQMTHGTTQKHTGMETQAQNNRISNRQHNDSNLRTHTMAYNGSTQMLNPQVLLCLRPFNQRSNRNVVCYHVSRKSLGR